MKPLPTLPPDGCTLSPEELRRQQGRAHRLAPFVRSVQREHDELTVGLVTDFDRQLLDELIATERVCCTFLDIGFDERGGNLTIRASDAQGREVVGRFADFFSGGAR